MYNITYAIGSIKDTKEIISMFDEFTIEDLNSELLDESVALYQECDACLRLLSDMDILQRTRSETVLTYCNESYDTNYRTYDLAMEGFGESVKNFFKKIGAWFKRVWDKLFGWMFKSKEQRTLEKEGHEFREFLDNGGNIADAIDNRANRSSLTAWLKVNQAWALTPACAEELLTFCDKIIKELSTLTKFTEEPSDAFVGQVSQLNTKIKAINAAVTVARRDKLKFTLISVTGSVGSSSEVSGDRILHAIDMYNNITAEFNKLTALRQLVDSTASNINSGNVNQTGIKAVKSLTAAVIAIKNTLTLIYSSNARINMIAKRYQAAEKKNKNN